MILRPSRAEFHTLAATHTIVPVSTVLLADLETPVAAFAKLVGDGDGFLLESVEHGERWGRFSFVGWDPVMTLTLRDGVVTVDGPAPVAVPTDRGILAAIEAVLEACRAPELVRSPSAVGRLDRLPRLRRHPRGRTPSARAARRPRVPGCSDEHDRLAGRLRPLAAARDADRERADPHDGSRRPRCGL